MRLFNEKQTPGEGLSYDHIPFDFDLEIGAGEGSHSLRYAKTNPSRTLVSIEKTRSKFKRFQSQLEKHVGVSNLIPVHTNAVWWVTHLPKDHSIRNCFILYPNPYPKHRQRNKRWHQMPFMQKLKEKMSNDARLYTGSNLLWYQAELETYCQKVWGLEIDQKESIKGDDFEGNPPWTKFEMKYRARGETCYRTVFRKKSS